MNKKLLSLALALSMLTAFMPIISSAETGTKYGDYLYYEINGDNTAVTITDCDTTATEITIPTEIEGLPVTSIGERAFQSCTSLTNVIIPESVTSIGYFAFFSCSSLANVIIPANVTNIDHSAFYFCRQLTNINVDENNQNYCDIDGNLFNKDKTVLIQYAVANKNNTSYTIPTSVTDIGFSAFSGCSTLESITIPDSITNIGYFAFYRCRQLANINVDENNQNYCDIGGNLFNKDKTVLIQYAIAKTDTSYTIPDSVMSIEHLAFESCQSLESITIGNRATSIGDSAFSYCSSLESITIPESIASIAYGAFSGCAKLADVYYSGTEDKWNDIDINDYDNDTLKNATIHYNSVIPTPTPDPDEPNPSPSASPTPSQDPDVVETSPDTYEIGEISSTDNGETLTISFTVTTKETVAGKQAVLVACYDENRVFIGLKLQQITASDEAQTISVEIDKEHTSVVKAFIWNATSSMMPASRPQSLEL